MDWVLTVPASGLESGSVALRVKKLAGDEPSCLNVHILATDSHRLYETEVRPGYEADLARAPQTKSNGSFWIQVLRYVLLGQCDLAVAEPQKLAALDLECSYVEEDEEIHLDIVQRSGQAVLVLGQLVLEELSPNASTQLSTWDLLQAAATKLRVSQLTALQAQAALEASQKQLQDFVETKRRGDQQMLERMVVVLNEKKRRIRSLQADQYMDESKEFVEKEELNVPVKHSDDEFVPQIKQEPDENGQGNWDNRDDRDDQQDQNTNLDPDDQQDEDSDRTMDSE